MSKTRVSHDGKRSITKGVWRYIGANGSMGFKTGKCYKLKVYIEHLPELIIYAYPTWILNPDGVFYDTHESFDSNWSLVK